MIEVDHRLLLAAKSLKYMLAPDFHDRARDIDSISYEEEALNRTKISNFAFETHLQYVYTLALKEGRFYFTAPTVTEEELKEREHWYFHPYEDAPRQFYQALEGREPRFVSYKDQWGEFRSVALPQSSPGGTWYLSCADFDIGYLEKLFRENLIRSTLSVLPLILLTLPFILFFRSLGRLHTRDLVKINRGLTYRAEEPAESKRQLEKEIGERLGAESSLRAGEEKLRNIFDMVQAGIMIVDSENHTVIDVNPAACNILENQKENIIGQTCRRIFCLDEGGLCPITGRNGNHPPRGR